MRDDKHAHVLQTDNQIDSDRTRCYIRERSTNRFELAREKQRRRKQDWWFLNNREKPAKRSAFKARCGWAIYELIDQRHEFFILMLARPRRSYTLFFCDATTFLSRFRVYMLARSAFAPRVCIWRYTDSTTCRGMCVTLICFKKKSIAGIYFSLQCDEHEMSELL